MNLAWVELWLFQFPSVSLHNRLEDFWYPQVIHMITTWIESSSKEFIHVGVGPIRPSMKIIRGTSPSPVCCVPIHPLNFASPAGDLPPRDFASPPGSLRRPRSHPPRGEVNQKTPRQQRPVPRHARGEINPNIPRHQRPVPGHAGQTAEQPGNASDMRPRA